MHLVLYLRIYNMIKMLDDTNLVIEMKHVKKFEGNRILFYDSKIFLVCA